MCWKAKRLAGIAHDQTGHTEERMSSRWHAGAEGWLERSEQ